MMFKHTCSLVWSSKHLTPFAFEQHLGANLVNGEKLAPFAIVLSFLQNNILFRKKKPRQLNLSTSLIHMLQVLVGQVATNY